MEAPGPREHARAELAGIMVGEIHRSRLPASTEIIVQNLRPSRPVVSRRHALVFQYWPPSRVWYYEVWQWFLFERRTGYGPTVDEFLKGPWNVARPRSTKTEPGRQPKSKYVVKSCSELSFSAFGGGP